jgi:hypothetical protein
MKESNKMSNNRILNNTIKHALRNNNITINNDVVSMLSSTRIEDVIALEADAGYDYDSTIVWLYKQSVDSNQDKINQLVDLEIGKWDKCEFDQLSDDARINAIEAVTEQLVDEEAEEAEEEEREPMSYNQLREIAHSLCIEGVYSFFHDGKVAKK